MAFFKRTEPTAVPAAVQHRRETQLPVQAPETKNGLRDFWQHWDYLLSMVPELAEFGVPVLDAIGLTLNESILAEKDVGTIKTSQVLIDKGTKVSPRMIPLLAGMGIVKVIARPSPRVLVIALSASAVAASYWVAAELQAAGAQAHRLEFISYAEPQLITAITEQLVRADLVVTLGGLGEAGAVGHTASDLRAVAAAIGANDFTPVAISPGSDHGFILAEEKVPLLALPAEVYPVFVLTKLLLEPMVAKLMGAGTDPVMSSAYLAQPLRIDPGVLTCVPAMVRDARMTISGRPRGLEGMNQIYHADALAILTSEYGLVDAGAEVFYLPLN